MNRVVVTGWGVVSPIGNTAGAFWSSLTSGTSGIGPVTLIPTDRLRQKAVAEVKDFDPRQHFSDRQLAALDRVSQFAVVAAREAIARSGVSLSDGVSERTATIFGCGVGGQTTHDNAFKRFYEEQQDRVVPMTIPTLMVNAPASQISIQCGVRGPAFVIASACASATHAIGVAFHMIRSGTVTSAVTGGAEACLTPGTIKAWEALRVMAPDTCRPFSADRQGLILGEGAAALVLESLDHARQRGAEILGEVIGFGMSADARDATLPDEGGMFRAIDGALNDAALRAEDVHYVNAHGTGTTANDATETMALKHAFGLHAGKLAISSTKSMTGHALGAAGAFGAVAALMAIREGIAPPTTGYREADPECDLDYVPNQARPMRIDAAIANAFAFGGLNAVLAFRRFA